MKRSYPKSWGRLFERYIDEYMPDCKKEICDRADQEYQAKGEWMDSWGIEINHEHHAEGYSFHLIGCPIAKLIRTKTELPGDVQISAFVKGMTPYPRWCWTFFIAHRHAFDHVF